MTAKRGIPLLLALALQVSFSLNAQLDTTDMAETLQEALTFDYYPTYPQYDSMMVRFANLHPDICRLDTFGTTVQGRLLLAVKLSDNVHEREDEPAFIYSSTMHGDELLGYNLMLRFIDYLLTNYDSDPEVAMLLNETELYINPLANPDGAYYPNDDFSVAASRRTNAQGYDLNRNFPDPGTAQPNDPTLYPKENGHMMEYLMEIGVNHGANIHGGSEVVNYPWDYSKDIFHPDDDWYVFISQEYVDEARSVDPGYLGLYDEGYVRGAVWYVIDGGRQDYVNYYLGGREVTLELSWNKRIRSEQLESFWLINKRSLLVYALQATYGIHGNVWSEQHDQPVEATIEVLNYDEPHSRVHSDPESGNFYRYLKQGEYDLRVSADGYLPDTLFGVQVLDYETTVLQVNLDTLGTGVEEERLSGFTVYPNPATTRITIATSGELPIREVILYSISGRKVLEQQFPGGTFTAELSLSGLSEGIYIVKALSSAGTGVRRIIVGR